MPIVIIECREGVTTDVKAGVAKDVTKAIQEIILSPLDLISVVFHDIPAHSTYRSGEPTSETLIFCHIRSGRTDETILNLGKAMSKIWSGRTGASENEIEVVVATYPAKYVVRGGERMEEPPYV